MRRHAKASTAGSTQRRRAFSIGAFAAILGALALCAALAGAAAPTATTGAASNIQKTIATLNGTVNPQGALLEECKFEYGTTTGYGQTAPCDLTLAEIGEGATDVAVKADIAGLSLGTTYHFRLVAKNAEGTSNGLDQSFKTLSAPVVEAWSTDVVYGEATLNAAIDPEGFATTYKFQWGPTTAYGSETAEAPAGSDSAVHEFSRFLDGLSEGTTYHYRVVATNANGTTETSDQTFTTYAHEAQDTSCANQAFRYGAGANLPNCRAYEMVSPVDKNGADIITLCEALCLRTEFNKASLNGNKLTYSSYKSFGDAVANAFSNQYLATRGPDGWSNHGISPYHAGVLTFPFKSEWDLEAQFRGFTDDLSIAWLTDDASPPLTADAVAGELNVYQRNNLTDGYRPLYTQPPTSGHQELGRETFVEGHSDNGDHVLFSVKAAYTPNAAASNKQRQLYDYSNGALHLVSVLPGGAASTVDSASGNGNVGTLSRPRASGSLSNAISRDGSRIYWTANATHSSGKIYVRVDGTSTVPVSETVSTANAEYLTATPDGSQALFRIGSSLYLFDLASESSSLIVSDFTALTGASDDLSRIYYVSGSELLLYDEGATKPIATLAPIDMSGEELIGYKVATPEAFYRASRVTPDGSVVAFQSVAKLTDYDNADAVNGEPNVEVYVYDADAEQLNCVSCRPSGARPVGQPLREAFTADDSLINNNGGPKRVWTAAWLTTAKRMTYTPRPLSEDGNRLFFNAFDALLPQDTNGQQDVYQWEAQGTGSCDQASGCLSLISSGKSSEKSEFVDATPGGRDVFFSTESSLLSQDPGLIDIYDARVDGGITPPPPPPPPCVGDSCQSVPAPPNDPTPASAAFRGAGDPAARSARSCTTQAKRAAKLSRRAKALRRRAKRLEGRRAVAIKRRSARYARKAKGLGKRASRCRRANRRAQQ